jgi:putative hydrolase of the HAD superfamily
VSLEAVVFDFDGLVIDSEWVIYESAVAAFAEHGHTLTLEAWATIVGTSDEAGKWERLCAVVGAEDLTREAYEASYEAQDRSNRDTLPPLPGVVALADALLDAGVPMAIASSSPVEWLVRHIDRLDLARHFPVLVGVDVVGGVGKPAPDVYLRACADLGADPRRAVALEDSVHGLTAAHAAGMAVVAVPGRVTASHDVSAAELVVGSLEDVTVADLAALVADR